MPRRAPLPPEQRGVAFRTSDDHGLSPGRLRGSDLQAPYRGVRVSGLSEASVLDRCRMFAPLMPSDGVFCSATAALIYRMPLPRSLENDPTLHVAVPRGRQPPRVRGVSGHALTLTRPRWHAAEIPLADPVETWIHLASVLSREDLVAVGDFLVSGRVTPTGREPALSTISELTSVLGGSRNVRGLSKLRWAIPLVRTAVDSRPESHLRLLFLAHSLPEPVVNRPVYSATGEYLGRPDLSYPHLKLLFEYEGDYHRTDPAQFRRDIARRERFEAAGWRTMRVTSDDLYVAPLVFIERAQSLITARESIKQ